MSNEATNKAMDDFHRLYNSGVVVFSPDASDDSVAKAISKILQIDGVVSFEAPALAAGLETVKGLAAFGVDLSLADAETTLKMLIEFFDGDPETEGGQLLAGVNEVLKQP